MIKIIAFDLVGVLVKEKDIDLTEKEDKLERLFGPNLSDEHYFSKASKIVGDKDELVNITKGIIDKLYEVKDKDLLLKIKEKYPEIKIIIATNHVSYIKDYIKKYLDNGLLFDVIISADINQIKPDKNFYYYILYKYNINPDELLFLDDNNENIKSADDIGINTILVYKDTDIINEIDNVLKTYSKSI